MVDLASRDDWTATWAPMVAAVGTDQDPGGVVWGADPIERSTVRRYLEPLELDCALHLDPLAARQHGYDDVIAPYTSFVTFTLPAMWEPGRRLFTSAERDAQPESSPIDGDDLRVAPEVTGFFATDMEVDFVRPAVVGERLGRRGRVLTACVPKWTAVGRGAFMTFESEVITEGGDVVARVRNTVFAYEPVGPPPPAPSGSSPEPSTGEPR
jgi:hypothetical protein